VFLDIKIPRGHDLRDCGHDRNCLKLDFGVGGHAAPEAPFAILVGTMVGTMVGKRKQARTLSL
jgi:hypothetical protein